jgi:hypothetical protein
VVSADPSLQHRARMPLHEVDDLGVELARDWADRAPA